MLKANMPSDSTKQRLVVCLQKTRVHENVLTTFQQLQLCYTISPNDVSSLLKKTICNSCVKSAALDDSGRTFQFSICIWGDARTQKFFNPNISGLQKFPDVWTWGSRVGHSWRMSGDASAKWDFIKSILTTNTNYLDYIDFYSHNDMDMMEIGNGDLTVAEQRTHFASWCFLKSPILLGTDVSLLCLFIVSRCLTEGPYS